MPDVRLSAQHFEEMITRRGVPVLWEKAIRCTCFDSYSGQPSYSCKACGGTGYVYAHPVKVTTVLIMSLVLSKDFTPVGDFRMGDLVATVPKRYKAQDANKKVIWPFNPMYDIGDYDKVTLLDSEYRAHDILVKDEPIGKRSPDTLSNQNITRVLNLVRTDANTGEVVEYFPEVDFTLNGNKVEWVTQNSPAPGEKYSVLYYYNPTYIVYTQLPQPRDQDGQNFPKKVVLRFREDILDG
jgi:hypothetical protein